MATISHHHVIACASGLRAKGLDPAPLYSRAAIHPRLLTDAQKRVHTDQVARLFKSVMEALDDEFMGFTAKPMRFGIFATMAELVSRCRTLGDLLRRAADFYNLVGDDVKMSLQSDGPYARFNIDMSSPQFDREHFLREFLLVIWHRFPSWFIGSAIPLLETHFSFSKPKHLSELEIMFPARLYFNQPCNSLVFDASELQRPLIRSSYELEKYLHNAPADFMTIPGSEANLERQLMRYLLDPREGGIRSISLEQAAAFLGVSQQTLHRRLLAEGTSFQTIKDSLRRERAIALLLEGDYSVEEISARLGFGEARSFTRAFKLWTGVSPRQYRKSHQ